MKSRGRFGEFGGVFVPEILFPALRALEAAFDEASRSASFQATTLQPMLSGQPMQSGISVGQVALLALSHA